ncbi:MAG: hypothetical protein CVV25_11645 [Ignavibacteriae bacterium HGW-Ignavibacteriae-4]|jgi:hypothetical protein|nr:MAG: hypothetical protein CVV25_11645 [Ignavibacteriae bacterium HGW-Ignavibacteriae-4]
MKILIVILATLMSLTQLYSQPKNLESNYSRFTAFAVDDNNFYIGLENGFVVQDKVTGGYEYYSTLNSELESNYINDINIINGVVYLTTSIGLYSFIDGEIKNTNTGFNNKFKIISDESGNLWTFQNQTIYKYDGNDIKEFNIDLFDTLGYLIKGITILDDYIWINYITSHIYEHTDRFALYNRSTNELDTFSYQERGFNGRSVVYQAITNNEIWLGTYEKDNFIFNIDTKKWRQNEYMKKIPIGLEFSYNSVKIDNSGKAWFSMIETDNSRQRYIAYYDNEKDSVIVKYSGFELTEKFEYLFITFVGDKLILFDKFNYYVQEGESFKEIKKADYIDGKLVTSKFIENSNKLYQIIKSDSVNNYGFYILEITENKSYKHNINELNKLPIPNIKSYLVGENTKVLYGGSNNYVSYADFLFLKDEWRTLWDLNFKFSYAFIQNETQELLLISNGVYKVQNNEIVKVSSIKKTKNEINRWHDVKIHEDNLYIYASDELNKDFHALNTDFEPFVTVISQDGSEVKVYDKDNSCFSKYFEYGKYYPTLYGSVPSMVEVDNNGNLWCLSTSALNIIDLDYNCERKDYLPHILDINKILYSKKANKMYGIKNNRIYNLSSSFLDTVNSVEKIGSELSYLGSCSDGNIYAGTTNGSLYRINSLDNWEPIDILSGKNKLDFKINHVSYFKDTLYISTEMGVFKVEQILSSVESKDFVKGFKIYPNPTQDYINIDSKYINEIIEIRTITGKLVLESKGTEIIDVSKLTSGVYIVKCGDRVTKFIKD